jgi:hypothetical protein
MGSEVPLYFILKEGVGCPVRYGRPFSVGVPWTFCAWIILAWHVFWRLEENGGGGSVWNVGRNPREHVLRLRDDDRLAVFEL